MERRARAGCCSLHCSDFIARALARGALAAPKVERELRAVEGTYFEL